MTVIDNQAFETLVRQHHRRLLGYALALVSSPQVAEDLTQEAFLVAYRELPRFDAERDFGAWVRGILRNKYREWARARQEPSLPDAAFESLEQQHPLWDQTERTAPPRRFPPLMACSGWHEQGPGPTRRSSAAS